VVEGRVIDADIHHLFRERKDNGMVLQKKMILVVLAAALLSVLFAACTIKDESATPAGPTVKMGATNFLVPTTTIQKGQMLTLTNTASDEHIITNGSWDGTVQKPAKEAGAPTVNVTVNGPQSQQIGPFNTAGTFHIYCTIHQGMNLAITVK
jgi:plastocyanin